MVRAIIFAALLFVPGAVGELDNKHTHIEIVKHPSKLWPCDSPEFAVSDRFNKELNQSGRDGIIDVGPCTDFFYDPCAEKHHHLHLDNVLKFCYGSTGDAELKIEPPGPPGLPIGWPNHNH